MDSLALVLKTIKLRVDDSQARSRPVSVSVFSMAILGKIAQASSVALVLATVNLVG